MTQRSSLAPAALAATLTLALAGCGLSDPYTTTPHPTPATPSTTTATPAASTPNTTATATNAEPAHEQGGTIPHSAQAAQNTPADGAAQPTPQAALERYATLSINWSAGTLAAVQRELAAISIGQARAQALQAQASYAHDGTLRESHVANSGSVIAIAAGQGPAAGSWVIVTQETTTGQGDYAGLPPADHVTQAQLTHTRDGWIVSSWSPRS